MQAVLNGDIPPEIFQDKIVLVGIIHTQGATDRYFVPSSTDGQLMAGVEVQAHAIETLLRDQILYEQSPLSQILMIVVLAIGSALLYVQVRWHLKLVLGAGMILAFLVIASVNFSLRHEIVNLFHGGLALALPVIVSVGLDITTEVRRRQRTEFLLASVVDVAGQQLEIDKIMSRIAGDVQRIIPAGRGSIQVYEENQTRVYEFSSSPPAAAPDDDDERPITLARQVKVPMKWQQRTIGMIAAQLEPGKRLDPTQLLMLEDLAQEIAPGLENAILYRETERQKELSQAILNGSPTYTVILDGNHNVIQSNEVLDSRLKDQLPDFRGRNLISLLKIMGVEEAARANLQRQLDRRQAFQVELRIGAETFNVYATLLSGYHVWVLVFSDVTALAELNRLKTQMIRMASHDLKNPLSGVLGYSNLLLMDRAQLSPDHQRFVELIQKGGDTMLNIINDILNLEQLRSTEMPDERVSLSRLVYDVISRHEPEMTLNRQQFKLEVQRNLPEMIGRPTQLGQAISNLLGNASKYTPEGGSITLRLNLIKPDTLRLEIADTGYGIPKEAQQKLFTEFYRVKTADTASIPGTGLGLSLVKSIVDAHHGKIWVESEEKVGSTFYVEFPIADDETPADPA
jgi:signal transduction histidine kinase